MNVEKKYSTTKIMNEQSKRKEHTMNTNHTTIRSNQFYFVYRCGYANGGFQTMGRIAKLEYYPPRKEWIASKPFWTHFSGNYTQKDMQ